MTINKSFKKLKENNFELFKLSFKCEDRIIKIVWGTQPQKYSTQTHIENALGKNSRRETNLGDTIKDKK